MSVKNVSEVRYFAACNSCRGFVSFYDDVFSGLNRLYIIKGRPGTGKSRLMRDVAADAVSRGYRAELYYCSSDPNSLDGLILPELSVGLLDGTSPHAREPQFPGIRDEIINLGAFWNGDALLLRRTEIEDLMLQKNRKYIQCYHYLNALQSVNIACNRLVFDAVNTEKIRTCADRILKNLKSGDVFQKRYGLRSAVSMRGYVTLPTYEEIAQNRIVIRDRYRTAPLLLGALLKAVEQKKQICTVSPCPIDPDVLEAIYIPSLDLSVYTDYATCASDADASLIHMDRFLSAEALRQNRAKLRFGKRCSQALLESANEELSEIGQLHFQLESIFTAAMNFAKKEALTADLISEIYANRRN